jgi:hypothetical protein
VILFSSILYYIVYYAEFIAININLLFICVQDSTFAVCNDTDSFEILWFAKDKPALFIPIIQPTLSQTNELSLEQRKRRCM